MVDHGDFKSDCNSSIGSVLKGLHFKVKHICESGQFCLSLGGDHGIATGSISGVKAVYKDLKVIWIDAHADINVPEESPSGNYHGMPVAHLLGWIKKGYFPNFEWLELEDNLMIKPEDIVYIGLRDLDEGEKRNLVKHNIKCYTMHHVDKLGIANVMDEIVDYFKLKDSKVPIHISLDIDGIDPIHAPGTGTRSKGGLNEREAHYILRELNNYKCIVSMDLVEINPLLDRELSEPYHGDIGDVTSTKLQTVSLGLELIASALGYKIL